MVVFIVGLVAGLVTLTFPQRPTAEQARAQAFAQVLRTAQDHAIMAGQPVGLELTETGYRLLQWRGELWRPQGRPETLPARMRIAAITDQQEQPDGWPDLIFDPTGIVTSAQFEFSGRGVRINIAVDEQGRVTLVER